MKYEESPDTLFLRVAVKDDEEAFKTIFFDFYPPLCVFAGRYICCPETCRDIVQETFFSIWKNRKKLTINTSFRNFLITSVRNKCTDYIRRQALHENYVKNTHEISALSSSSNEIYTINELQKMIDDALQKLPENVRRAFELNRFQEMTYVQIAEEMQVSVKTIESYMSRALKILREELKDYLPFMLLFLW